MYFSTTDDSIELEKIQNDLAFLLGCFKKMLQVTGEKELAEMFESQQFSFDEPEKISKAFTLLFQLTTIVEENAAVQLRRKLEDTHGLSRVSGLWGKTLKELRESGFSEVQIAETMAKTRIEPVLTAHPTESKRSTVIDQLRAIYLMMVKRENSMWTRVERKQIENDIVVAMQRLWHTGQVYLQKPSIEDERRNVIYYLAKMFPKVLPLLDQRLKEAWSDNGFDVSLLENRSAYPAVRFGNWVGGDRDGHPFVTSSITEETLFAFRKEALSLLK
ncbi:phosphoenolpyruvate carboxylase, partial [Balneolaceae bacterium ANBcel3]|nr:phosphoenolpyruvate carboxylase [Balneolaceae bacterium ANBcel3]